MKLHILPLLLPVFFGFSWHSAFAQCQYRLEMHDVNANGWEGATLTLNSNGVPSNFTLDGISDNGLDETVYFGVTNNTPLEVSWQQGAFFSNWECSFKIFDYYDNPVFEATGPLTGMLFSVNAVCPSCLKPADFKVENVYDTRVKLRWTPAGINPGVAWLIIYGPEGFDLAAGEGDTVNTTLPKLTLTGLQKNSGYECYVIQDCGNNDYSIPAGPLAFHTLWSNDVGIFDILAPQSSCDLGIEKVRIVMKNYGANPQSLIPFRYTVNGIDAGVGQPDDGFFTGVLGKDSCTTIEFETMFDFSGPGEYLIAVFTELEGDEEVSNDTFYTRIVNRLEPPYTQNFEDWNGAWYVDTISSLIPSWEFGHPAGTVISSAASGENAWVTNLDGSYNAAERSYLNSPCFDFSNAAEDPVIQFSINYFIENSYDGAYLEMSVDGGNMWETVGALGEGLNWYTETNLFSNLGDVWAGISNGWLTARHSLFSVAGESDVRLRFGFGADGFLQYEGVGIDDIRIYVPYAKDLVGLQVSTLGENIECGLANDKVTFTLTNYGTANQGAFPVMYSVNDGPPVAQTVNTIISPDEIYTFTFTVPFNSMNGEFTIKCWTALTGEQYPLNDTITYFVSHLPRPVPFHENFEDKLLPNGWSTTGYITNTHNNISFVLTHNLYSSNTTFSHNLARYGIISAGDSLQFDYRITNFSAGTQATILSPTDHFNIDVSTNCGANFQTIYTINSTNHTPMVGLQTRKIDLSQFAGNSVQIRFNGFWGSGDYWFDLDNIGVLACPAGGMLLTATTTASDPVTPSGTATISVGIGTPPFTYLWSDGQTTETASNLPPGVTTVTVTDSQGCSDMLSVNIGNTGAVSLDGLTAFSLRPNPTSGTTRLSLNFDRPVELRTEVISLLGQTVWQNNAGRTERFDENIGLHNLPDGLYLLRIMADGRTQTEKLVKSSTE